MQIEDTIKINNPVIGYIIQENPLKKLYPPILSVEDWYSFCEDVYTINKLILEYNTSLRYTNEGSKICVGQDWANKFAPEGKYLDWPVINLGNVRIAFIAYINTELGNPIEIRS